MKKRKIGILTFHQANNYGAALQAFALKSYCETLGYESHIINYKALGDADKVTPLSDFIQEPKNKKALIKLIRSSMSLIGDQKRAASFIEFRRKYLDETEVCYTPEDIANLKYDIYISGSDQIWNYQITSMKFDPIFFLQFKSNAKKIIYAASSQDTPFPLDWEIKFKGMLEKTDAIIGIREKKLADYVYSITGSKYPVVADPTILAGKDILDKIPSYNKIDVPYILIYQIDSNPYSDVSVKALEKRFKCRVYTMTVPRLGSFHGRKGATGPEGFMGLLRNAEFLVTNSFHGIALSLIYQKQFYVYENGGVMSRIDGLLKQTGLTDRKIRLVKDIDLDKKIDYTNVTQTINRMQEKARLFLEEALKGNVIPISDNETEEVEEETVKDKPKEMCCGCSACSEICPVKAIKMTVDEEGFLYPHIDESKCIKCKLCVRVCNFKKAEKRAKPYDLPLAYGVKYKNQTERESSRSGAAFIGISNIFLANNGVVYGAVMQKDFSVKHMRAESAAQRDKMKTAKYVQSTMLGICTSIERDLKNNKQVLFSGTPCQVSGVKSYLTIKNVPQKQFYSCDLVCHGVPSPLIWDNYINYIKQKYHVQIVEANFRDKEFGWDSHCESFRVKDRNKKIVRRDYTDMFYDHIMFRPSCHVCPFANVQRPGDITLADFWGIEKHNESFNDNKGVSLVLINDSKGEQLFRFALHQFDYFKCDIKTCLQPTLIRPSAPSPRRKEFWTDFQEMSFDSLIKKYTTPISMQGKLKKYVKEILYIMGVRKHP